MHHCAHLHDSQGLDSPGRAPRQAVLSVDGSAGASGGLVPRGWVPESCRPTRLKLLAMSRPLATHQEAEEDLLIALQNCEIDLGADEGGLFDL